MLGTLIIVFIVGAIVGSLLNVVIYRYPIMLEREWNAEAAQQLHQDTPEKSAPLNLYLPRSHCPHCKHKISAWHNIPLLSFLLLRATCAYCHAKISFQYFFVELLTAVLSVIVVLKFQLTPEAMGLLVLTWGLIVLSFIDFRHQFLPDAITYCLLWIGLLFSTKHVLISPAAAIIGAVVGYLFLWIIAKLYFLLRKQEGIGLGDCKMLAMIGTWTGALSLLNVLIFSTITALIISLILICFKKITPARAIPFGPFIAMGGWITLLFGPEILMRVITWLA